MRTSTFRHATPVKNAAQVSFILLLLLGGTRAASGQEQTFSRIDDEILHMTPVTRQLDFPQFQASLGSFRTSGSHPPMFHFDNVLLPASAWTDDDPDAGNRMRLENAGEIRRSILPQFNPKGTLTLLLNGNGQTALDSESGTTEFRSNSPAPTGSLGAETPSGGVVLLPVSMATLGLLLRTKRSRSRHFIGKNDRSRRIQH